MLFSFILGVIFSILILVVMYKLVEIDRPYKMERTYREWNNERD